MTSADEALQIVLDNVAPLGVERRSITAALGRVLAEEIHSPRDIPGFDNSAMDGYAVRAADVASASESNPVTLEVLETVGAGTMPSRQHRGGARGSHHDGCADRGGRRRDRAGRAHAQRGRLRRSDGDCRGRRLHSAARRGSAPRAS